MDCSRLLVIGDVNIDIIIQGLETIPEMGQETFVDNIFMRVGGGAANTAIGLSKLECNTALCGALGDDSISRFVVGELQHAGIDLRYMAIHKDLPTGISVSISTGGDRLFISSAGASLMVNPDAISTAELKQFSHVHFSAWNPRQSLAAYSETAKRAHKMGCTVSFDIGWTDGEWNRWELFDMLQETDVFFPNLIEARNIFGNMAECDELGSYFLKHVRDIVVITNGANGATAYGKNGEKYWDSYKANAIDAVGAGDAFNAGFLSAYVCGKPLQQCLSYGCAAGSVAVSRVGGGASAPSREELIAITASHCADTKAILHKT